MKIIKGLPMVTVNKELCINTLQYLNEDEDTITLQTPEYLPMFKRGYVCNMCFEYSARSSTGGDCSDKQIVSVDNLVLVHIRRTLYLDEFPTIEYIFYK